MSAGLSLFHAVREFLGLDQDTATPAEAQALEARFNEWIGNRRISIVDITEHPSRSAKLCKDCKHFRPADLFNSRFDRCDSPSAPIDLVKGAAKAMAASMRDDRMAIPTCGSSAVWFSPAQSPENKL